MAGKKAINEDDDDRLYRAPALEKGLDILELLSNEGQPLTLAAMTQHLQRSTGELFRMIQVLEYRGYIAATPTGAYAPTSKLFRLGMTQAPVKSLLEHAIPCMRRLTHAAEQSCHLVVRAEGDMVVVARAEAAGMVGFSVRPGLRRPIHDSASGLVLYACQPESERTRWEATFEPKLSGPALTKLHKQADEMARQGYLNTPSRAVPGIIDLSAPVMRGDMAAAALTIPYVDRFGASVGVDQAVDLLVAATRDISAELALSDLRE